MGPSENVDNRHSECLSENECIQLSTRSITSALFLKLRCLVDGIRGKLKEISNCPYLFCSVSLSACLSFSLQKSIVFWLIFGRLIINVWLKCLTLVSLSFNVIHKEDRWDKKSAILCRKRLFERHLFLNPSTKIWSPKQSFIIYSSDRKIHSHFTATTVSS